MKAEEVPVHFSSGGLLVLNICLAIIMFGVALDIQWKSFLQLKNQTKGLVTGLVSQFILLPLLTVIMIKILPIENGIALGMLLVACCPGGNVSNFYTSLANGHVALSVTLTAISSLAAFFIVPINFMFWTSFFPELADQISILEIDLYSLMSNMILILLLPLLIGMWIADRYTTLSKQIARPIRIISMLMLAAIIIVAVYNNREGFLIHLDKIFLIVLIQNGSALILAYYFSKLLKNDEGINRTVAIETGIQNSGLGLILIFNFFDGNTSMAIVAAWWGVWHLISGFIFASFMRRRSLTASAD